VLSHSFGPFHSKLSKKLVRSILAKISVVSCRESISRNILLECGVDPDRVLVTPDFGFGVFGVDNYKGKQLIKKCGLEEGQYVAITARPWFHKEIKTGNVNRYKNYIHALAKMCDFVIESGIGRVALIVQNDGSHSVKEPDIGPLREIQKNMIHHKESLLLEEDFSFRELTSLYKNARFIIGTRLHSCIFSFCVGTPAIAIAYSHKSEGIMEMVGAQSYVLPIIDLDIEQGRKMITTVLETHDELSGKYKKRAVELRSDLVCLVDRLLFQG
jgi:colanic acid/amylovoran biosynthesis protein